MACAESRSSLVRSKTRVDELAAAARICTMFPTRETRAKRCNPDEEWASPQCGRAVGGGEVLLEDCGAVGNPLLDTGRIELAHIAVGSERIKGAARVKFAKARESFWNRLRSFHGNCPR